LPGNVSQATAGAERMRPAAWYVHGTLQGIRPRERRITSFGSAVSTCRRSRTRKENSTAQASAVREPFCGRMRNTSVRPCIHKVSADDPFCRSIVDKKQSPASGAVFCCGSGSPVRLKWTGDGSKADRSGPKVDRRKIKCGSERTGDRSNGGRPCVRFGSDVDRACVESGSGVVQMWIGHTSKPDRVWFRSGSTVRQILIKRVRVTDGKTGRQNFVRDLQLNQHGFNGIIRKKRSMDRLQMTGE